MSLILAIETSTLTASVAVVRDDQVLSSGESGVNTHSERLLGLVDDALKAAGHELGEVDAIAAGAGPGSFTGLRIGMATAKGLAFAADKPLWLVSSLAALALDGRDAEAPLPTADVIVPIMDARRGEIFAGFFEVTADAPPRSLHDEQVLKPTALADVLAELQLDQPALCGDGLEKFAELGTLGRRILGARLTPSAASVGKLALLGDHHDALANGAPVYIRKSEAEIKFPNGNPGGAFRNTLAGDKPT